MALIEREATESAIAKLMPSFTTPDGSGVIDEMIFSAQQICAEAIETIHVLPTIDPIRAAGKCYCRECKHGRNSTDAFEFGSLTPLCECDYMTLPHRWYEHCSWGVPKEAQGDG